LLTQICEGEIKGGGSGDQRGFDSGNELVFSQVLGDWGGAFTTGSQAACSRPVPEHGPGTDADSWALRFPEGMGFD